MTDEQIQELILVFLDKRGGYVASASERELFLLVKGAVLFERERCATIAERQSLYAEQRIIDDPDLKSELLHGSAAAALIAGAIRRGE